MAARKKQTFSAVKAVKALARERIGTPPAVQTLPDEKTKAAHRASKHKVTLSRLLQQSRDETVPVRRD